MKLLRWGFAATLCVGLIPPQLPAVGADLLQGPGPTARVLIVGDSWAESTWRFSSLDEAFTLVGHADKVSVGHVTALRETGVEEWITYPFRILIQQELVAHPTIDVVHLQVYGNDFLRAWNAQMTPNEEQALYTRIADGYEDLVTYILGIDPNIQVLVAGYDYLNMEELPQQNPNDFLVWQGLGFPTPQRLNEAFMDLSIEVLSRVRTDPRVYFVNNTGVMQYVFGYPSLGIAPRSLPLPGNFSSGWRPLLGGDSSLPSPPEAMFNSIHLNGAGYDALALHTTVRFYDAYFNANP